MSLSEEKDEVVDLVIKELREHESNLDELIGRLEKIVRVAKEGRRRRVESYAAEFRRQARAFRALAKIVGSKAETEEQRAMAEAAEGLASVCDGMAEWVEERGEMD